jgi:L-fuconolactonase
LPDVLPSRIVFVQAGCARTQGLAEADWVASLAQSDSRIAGIVAQAEIDRGPLLAPTLEKLTNNPLVRGVRHLIQDEADPEFCLRPAFVTGVRALAPAGLSFDVCCRPHQLSSVGELVRRCPETRFVLDHAGKPAITRGEIDSWRAEVSALATLPNVVCKLSGLVTEANHSTWHPNDLRPWVDHLVTTFGPQRLLFGSDWPVVKLAASYRRWLDAAQDLLSALSSGERDAIFHRNATRIYRLA